MSVMPIPVEMQHRGPLTTPLGKLWAQRMRVADRYYETNCADFDELLNLYVSAQRLRNDWNANVSMAWSVLQNLVADGFFKNPEPVIVALSEAREDEARMLVDVGRTWHETAGTEENVMRARILCGLHGGAVIWIDEDADYQDAAAYDDQTGEPMVDDETGEPVYELDEHGEPLQEAVRQEFRQTLIDLHGWRVDPDCRRWDHRDAKWVSRPYEKSLQEFLDDKSLSDATKAMLRTYAKSRKYQKQNWTAERDANEQDPSLQMIACDEIWSMAHGRIIHLPRGAEFHLEGSTEETREGFPMPEFWRKLKMYPGVLFAYNWHPPDKDGRKGYYPVPDLRLVKSQLKNLIRLEGLILNLCTQQTTKYLIQDGIVDNKVQRRLASDVPRELIPVDFVGAIKRLVSAGISVPGNLEHLIVNLRTEQREQLVKHFEAFEHEVNIIRETLSQGPSQRGGVADSQTATGQLQVGQALQRRLDIESERTSAYIDQLTERYFIFLQARLTTPLYIRGRGDGSEQTLQQFIATQQFRELKLSFTHRTGTARGIDRELLRIQIREAINNALPAVQDPTQIQVLLRKLFETFDDPALARVFENDLSGMAEQAAMVIQQIEQGQMPLEEAGPVLFELLAAFVNAHLTQASVERVAQRVAGGGPSTSMMPTEAERRGSAPKPKSAGKQAFDTAAGLASAGRVGGVN